MRTIGSTGWRPGFVTLFAAAVAAQRVIRRLLLLAVSAVGSSALAATLHVDASNPNCPGSGTAFDPFCTIQAAIAAASSGDAVLVAPGTYAENFDFLGKAIAVSSTGGATVTIVVAPGGSVVSFTHGEGAGSRLEGFTLRGGDGTPIPPFDLYAGAGILCLGASPVIRANVVEVNDCRLGAGIYLGAGSAARIEDNTIRENGGPLFVGPTSEGGGIGIVDSSPVIRGNRIVSNHGISGAGISIRGTSTPLIEDNEIRDNHASSFGEGSGGGIECNGKKPVIRNNRILDNGSYEGGGGIECGCDASITGNELTGNAASGRGDALALYGTATVEDNEISANGSTFSTFPAGAVTIGGASRLARNTIRDNVGNSGIIDFSGLAVVEDNLLAGHPIDGVSCLGPGSLVLRRNTIVGNAFGIFVDNGATPVISDSIVYGNANGEIVVFGGMPTVSYSDVKGGFPGAGNLDADPQFVAPALGDYRLLPSSPCIDAGDPASSVCGIDLGHLPRPLDGDLAGGMFVDMGAHEFGNVHLAIDETSTPQTTSIAVTGTPGLALFLVVGIPAAPTCFEPYGPLFLNLAGPFVVVPLGTSPLQFDVSGPRPASFDPPLAVQAIGLTSGGHGNVSNLVSFPQG